MRFFTLSQFLVFTACSRMVAKAGAMGLLVRSREVVESEQRLRFPCQAIGGLGILGLVGSHEAIERLAVGDGALGFWAASSPLGPRVFDTRTPTPVSTSRSGW